MISNLQAQYERTGRLLIIDAALEVAFTGESWPEVCRQAEEITGCKPGVYRRFARKVRAAGTTLDAVVSDALEAVAG